VVRVWVPARQPVKGQRLIDVFFAVEKMASLSPIALKRTEQRDAVADQPI
jgi:hypothetical protein